MGTIRIFPGSIRPTTDSSYGGTGSIWSSTSSIDSTCYFSSTLLLVALKRKILQKRSKKMQKIVEKPGPIRTCVDSKSISTGSRSNLTSSIYSTNQLFIWSLSSFPNHQNPSKTTTIYGKTKIDSHLCRFQVNHC